MRLFYKIGRIRIITGVICICLLFQFVLSYKLWYPAGRQFPLISAFDSLQVHYGLVIDALLCIVAIGCFLILLFKVYRWVIAILILVFALLVLEDITRLQPWLYLFSFMLITLSIFNDREDDALFVLRIILAATYFWSGAQKLNHDFVTEVFPWLMNPAGLRQFCELHHRIVYIVPFIELGSGLGLLFKKWQKLSGVVLILMHLILIYSLGPWGNNWNLLIWPWNIAMVAIIVVVMRQDNYVGFISAVRQLVGNKWLITVVVLLGIMPAFNYLGMWDNYLSGSLYSGAIPEAVFYYDNQGTSPVPIENDKLYYREKQGEYFIIDGWALAELNTPVYPEGRYFKRIAATLCNKEKYKRSAGLLIIKHKKFTSEIVQEDCKCDSLAKAH